MSQHTNKLSLSATYSMVLIGGSWSLGQLVGQLEWGRAALHFKTATGMYDCVNSHEQQQSMEMMECSETLEKM